MTRHRASRDAWMIAAVWSFASLAALVLRPWASAFATLAPGCVFHQVTGLPCPTCGATHAALALAAGDPVGALLWNPLAALVLGAAWAGGLAAPLWLALGLPVPGIPTSLSLPVRVTLVGLALADWCFLVFRGV